MILRTATRDDVPGVEALLQRSYPRLLKADYAPSVLVTALPLISRAQPRLVTCGTYYVIEDEGTVVAAGGWTAAPPQGHGRIEGVAHVRHVATDPDRTRAGLGRHLMEHVVAAARAAGHTRMDSQSTLTAVPFYRAMGFGEIGPIEIELRPGIVFPAMAMTRRI